MFLVNYKLQKKSTLFFSALFFFFYIQSVYAGIETSVENWAKAWSSQNIDLYLKNYSEEFMPEKGVTREVWENERKVRLITPSYIKVVLSGIKVNQYSENSADIEFFQHYQSNSYTDEVKKHLSMQKVKDRWLIVEEKVVPIDNVAINLAPKEEIPDINTNDIEEDTSNFIENAVAEKTSPNKENIEKILNHWLDAWSSQDINTYLATYAESFVPSKKLSREKWEKHRRDRILTPRFIKVTLSETEIKSFGTNYVDVEFSQSYQSDNYSDDVRKFISMHKIEDQWLITKEKIIDRDPNEEKNIPLQEERYLVAELNNHDDITSVVVEAMSTEEESIVDNEGILRRRDTPPETVLEERSGSPRHEGHQAPPEMDSVARPSEFEPDLFGSDPTYRDNVYDVAEQLKIYGGKTPFNEPRPVLELGYPQYSEGVLGKTYDVIGKKNLLRPQLLIFGDFRTALAFNDNGAQEIGQLAARLNLDVDLKLTATERIHMFLRPIDKNNNFLRHEFFGDDHDEFDFVLDGNIETLYFEGDIGAIQSGLTDKWATYDLPFAFGFMPLLFQNGIWVDDAFVGAAFAIPAMNSPKFDISNMDISFFTGIDKVTTAALKNAAGQLEDSKGNVFGVTTFIETREGYFEGGYGFIDDKRDGNGLSDFDHHSLTAAWTKRYWGKLSNSVRGFWTLGQSPNGSNTQTADGFAILIENSLITSKPSFLIPYANFFVGVDRPQPLVRGNDGLLKNTGIAFETDGLTGFPKLDSSAQDAYGFAIGIENLFDLSRQIVFEFATVQPFGGQSETIVGDQYALSVRYQHNLNDRWILRTDAILGILDDADNLSGVRLELRRKF
jgi:ketosteroid isomerase-like protein